MINIHWSWVIFVIIVAIVMIKINRSGSEVVGDYAFDIETPFWYIILIAFILVWGGIFWW